jgi:hypothetical protein
MQIKVKIQFELSKGEHKLMFQQRKVAEKLILALTGGMGSLPFLLASRR